MKFVIVITKNIPCSQLSQQESEEMFRLTMQPVMKYIIGQFVDDTFKNFRRVSKWTGLTETVRGVRVHEAHSLQMSVKLTKEVFLVPTRTTWGGFITNFLFSPATMSGFFSLMMLKTRLSSWDRGGRKSYTNSNWQSFTSGWGLKK